MGIPPKQGLALYKPTPSPRAAQERPRGIHLQREIKTKMTHATTSRNKGVLDVVCDTDSDPPNQAERSPSPLCPPQGRREQNRLAQHAFRQRRKAAEVAQQRRIRQLEGSVEEMSRMLVG